MGPRSPGRLLQLTAFAAMGKDAGLQAYKCEAWRVLARPLSVLSALLPLLLAYKGSKDKDVARGELPVLAAAMVLLCTPALVQRPWVTAACYLGRSIITICIGRVPLLPSIPQGVARLVKIQRQPFFQVVASCIMGAFQVRAQGCSSIEVSTCVCDAPTACANPPELKLIPIQNPTPVCLNLFPCSCPYGPSLSCMQCILRHTPAYTN